MTTANGSPPVYEPPGVTRAVHHAKLVLLGETGTGKSSLVLRFAKGDFAENQQATIGAAFMTQILRVKNNVIKFEIWDTAGAERYRSLAPMYYRGAAAAVVVYDITDHDSFEKAKGWVLELKKYSSSNIIIALTGNKIDLAKDRTVDSQQSRSYAENNGLIFMETSAKSGVNVENVFLAIANNLPAYSAQNSRKGRPDPVVVQQEKKSVSKPCC